VILRGNHMPRLRRALCAICVLTFAVSYALCNVIHVPGDQPTIQSAINVAEQGDTVLVDPGVYHENITFLGKAIRVVSVGGASSTTIDGGGTNSVVIFDSGETNASTLSGFTLRNGYAQGLGEGGGISVENSAPTITNNVITNNQACYAGDGIGVGFGSPVIVNNTITLNSDVCGGLGGGGISFRGVSTGQIVGNLITNNQTASYGGGIALWSATGVLIKNNLISGNVSGGTGGGISMYNDVSSVVVVQNLIIGNTGEPGNEIFWSNGPGIIVNNTIADIGGTVAGSPLWVYGYNQPIHMQNNIITAAGADSTAIYCSVGDFSPGVFTYNDAFNPSGPVYGGVCTDQTGTNGNISADPKFVGGDNFYLQNGSPAIDAGDNSAPDLPTTDFDGRPRILWGHTAPQATGGRIDMGAYEYVPMH
jgi:hypothetical protein